MHDLEFDHLHYVPDDEVNEVAWATDNVELTHRRHRHRLLDLAPDVLARAPAAARHRAVEPLRRDQAARCMWQSPIMLTPYLPDYTIDTDELAEFFGGCYHLAQVDPDDVDSGAVILTGEAIKRHNARAIADLFSEVSGKFVCASAGHHMECQMAAHGSGAVAHVARHTATTVLNVDIGGGTTKLALIEKGEILATIAIAVGGRLIVEDKGQGMTRIEEPAQEVARSLGIDARARASRCRRRTASASSSAWSRQIMRMIDRRPPDELSQRLLVTDPWPAELANKTLDAITFSGGVAEYLYKRENAEFRRSRLRPAEGLRHMLARRKDLPPVWDPGQGIRATVIGAAQFSVQVSRQHHPDHQARRPAAAEPAGGRLHVRSGRETVDPAAVTAAVRKALGRSDIEEGAAPARARLPLARRSVARAAACGRQPASPRRCRAPSPPACRWCC